jgi:group I intron endonuclease
MKQKTQEVENQLMTGFIYQYTHKVNSKMYIGKTRQVLQDRLDDHKTRSFQKTCRNYECHFHRAIRKYGYDTFNINILHTIIGDSVGYLDKELYKLEVHYIAEFNSFNDGYNSDKGGRGTCGMKHSKETRARISSSNMGKVMSEEAKVKMREAGRKRVEAELLGISNVDAKNRLCKTVYLYYKDILLVEFKSTTIAGKLCKVDPSSINKCCKGEYNYTGKFPDGTGMVWRRQIIKTNKKVKK